MGSCVRRAPATTCSRAATARRDRGAARSRPARVGRRSPGSAGAATSAAAGVEVDDEAGRGAGVDDLGDRAVDACARSRPGVASAPGDPDLLGPDAARARLGRAAARPPSPVEQVGGADEAGDERASPAARRPRPAVPTCSIRPSLKTAIRSLIVSASSWSWVTKTKVMPTSRWIALSSTCICSRSLRSRAPSGSSSSSTRGRLTRARASATRWRWPPESWPGRRSPKPSSRTASQRLARPAAVRSALADALDPQAVGDVLRARVMCGNSA